MTQNFFDLFMRNIPELLSQNSGLFVSMGLNLYIGICTIMLWWFGVEFMLGANQGPRLVPLLWTMALVGTILTFYATPIPGVGRGFRQIFTDQALDMSRMISQGHVQAVMERLQEFTNAPGVAPSSAWDISGALRKFLLELLVALAQALTIIHIAFGFLAAAVAGLLGPCFIPFFLVPGMEWMGWGWLKAFIQYSFYGVIANAYTFVMMQALLNFGGDPGKPMDIAVYFVSLIVVLIAYIYGMSQLPSLVNSIFSGRSGESVFRGL